MKTKVNSTAILEAARKKIGTPYASLDCSHFVNEAYRTAGYDYTYKATASFVDVPSKMENPNGKNLGTAADGKFLEVHATDVQDGDVLLFPGHMGIWDSQGCQALINDPGKKDCKECYTGKKVATDRQFLSARTSVGTNYGKTSWFGKGKYRVFRWAE